MSQDNDPSKPKPTVQNPPQPQPTNVVTTVASETTATSTNPPEVLEDTPEAFQKRRDEALAKSAKTTTNTNTNTTTTEAKQ